MRTVCVGNYLSPSVFSPLNHLDVKLGKAFNEYKLLRDPFKVFNPPLQLICQQDLIAKLTSSEENPKMLLCDIGFSRLSWWKTFFVATFNRTLNATDCENQCCTVFPNNQVYYFSTIAICIMRHRARKSRHFASAHALALSSKTLLET